MEFTRITGENENWFSSLLPERVRDEDQEAFGLIGEDGAPVASAILSGKGGNAALTWILVHPEARRKGYGSLLLKALKNLVREETDHLCMHLPEGAEDLERWLSANDFLVTEGDPIYRFTLDSVLNSSWFAKCNEQESTGAVRPVSELNRTEAQALFDLLEAESGAEGLLLECDPAISFAAFDEKGRPVSCLLTDSAVEGAYWITYLLNNGNPVTLANLFQDFAGEAAARKKENATLQFLAVEENARQLGETLLSECEGGTKQQLEYAVTVL